MHDWSYHLGFTEENWNMQQSNFGLHRGRCATGERPGARPVAGRCATRRLADYLGRDNANMRRCRTGLVDHEHVPLAAARRRVLRAVRRRRLRHAGHRPRVRPHDREPHDRQGRPRSGDHAGAMGESHGDLIAMEVAQRVRLRARGRDNRYAVGTYATGNKVSAASATTR